MDAIDLKDLQYQVVQSRKKAIKLITDIHEAEVKAFVKNIKEIESRPINAQISYKPMNLDKLRYEMKPTEPTEDKTQEQIAGIRGALKALKRPVRT